MKGYLLFFHVLLQLISNLLTNDGKQGVAGCSPLFDQTSNPAPSIETPCHSLQVEDCETKKDQTTQLTSCANELYPASTAWTQTPINWHIKGIQTAPRMITRGKDIFFQFSLSTSIQQGCIKER